MLILGIPVYFFAALHRNALRFFYFLLMQFVMTFTFLAMSRLIAALFSNVILASHFGAALIASFLLYNGFLISRPRIPRPWIWAHYIDPLRYTVEGLAINEYKGVKFFCEPVRERRREREREREEGARERERERQRERERDREIERQRDRKKDDRDREKGREILLTKVTGVKHT
jgi:hypothetical protein